MDLNELLQRGPDPLPPCPALTPPACSARFRAVIDFVGDRGTVFYMLQQKRWWGWSQISHSVLTKDQAETALKELKAIQNASVPCYAVGDVSDDDVDDIEEDVGMGCGAWDCENPKKIIAAAWNQLSRGRTSR